MTFANSNYLYLRAHTPAYLC